MAVLDLQNVADDGVCGQRLDEVVATLLELGGRRAAKLLQEVLVKVDLERFAQVVARVRIRHDLNDATEELLRARTVRNTAVWIHKQVKIVCLKYTLHVLDELHGQNVLPQIVVRLEDTRDSLCLARPGLLRLGVLSRLLRHCENIGQLPVEVKLSALVMIENQFLPVHRRVTKIAMVFLGAESLILDRFHKQTLVLSFNLDVLLFWHHHLGTAALAPLEESSPRKLGSD